MNPLEYCKSFQFDDKTVFSSFLQFAKAGKPASLIRMGDGEAKLLGYPESIDLELVQRQMRIWFGTAEMAIDDILFLRRSLLSAVLNATHLGMPAPPRTGEAGDIGGFSRDAINCQALWRRMHELRILPDGATLAGANVHTWAQKSRALSSLLHLPFSFLFITRSRAGAERVASAFDMRSYQILLVPGETWSRPEGGPSGHYPARFQAVSDQLRGVQPGTVALVGAGVLGKLYCEIIRSSGGAAFDCGALFDAWADDVPKQRAALTQHGNRMTVQHLLDT